MKKCRCNLDQLVNVELVRQGKSGKWGDAFALGELRRFNKLLGSSLNELRCFL